MTVSMYSCARCSVASFTGSWCPCACTCRGSNGQGQVTSTSGWWRLDRARRHLTSFSRSFRTRSTTSTSDLSFIQVSMFCWGQDGAIHRQGLTLPLGLCLTPPPQPLLWACMPPLPPPVSAPPYRFTDSLKVQSLQLLGHLFVPLPVPAIKVGGLEKPPVGGKMQQLWDDPVTPCARADCTNHCRSLRIPSAIHPPVEAQPVALEDTGELGPCMLQATQEVILAEGADLGRSLRQGPGEPRLVGDTASQASPAPQLARTLPCHTPQPREDPQPPPFPGQSPSCVAPIFPSYEGCLACWGQPRALGTPAHPMTSSSLPPSQTFLLPELGQEPTLPGLPQTATWTRTFQGVMLFCRGMRLAM